MTTSNTIIRPIDDFDVWKWHEIRTFLLEHQGSNNCSITVSRYASRGTKNSMYMTIRSGKATIAGWAWVPANHSWTSIPHQRIPENETWEAQLETYGDESKRQVKLTLLNSVPVEEHVPSELEENPVFTTPPLAEKPNFDEVANAALIDELMKVRGVHATGLRKLPYSFRARVTFLHADKRQPSIYLNFIKDGIESVGTVRFTAPKHIKPLINLLNNKVCDILRDPDATYGPEAFQVSPIEEVFTVNANPEAPTEPAKNWYNIATQKPATDVQTITREDGIYYVFTYEGKMSIKTAEVFLKYYSTEAPYYYKLPKEGLLALVDGNVRRIVAYENSVIICDDGTTITGISDVELLPDTVQEAWSSYINSTKVN